MDDNKKTYYIDPGTGEISQSQSASSWSFKIQANDDEITRLRELFDQNYSTEWQGFWRAHIPFLEYHHDKDNHQYDNKIQEVYQMIYQLGDQEAKNHIETMNILPGTQ